MEWKVSKKPEDYEEAVAFMERRVEGIKSGKEDELVWLLEHPPLYTAGTSASDCDLLDRNGFPVYKTGRGGQYTYHGPGQRIAYVMLDLKKRTPDVRRFVAQLEEWIIITLAEYGIKGEVREGRVGVWVNNESRGYSGGVLYDDLAQSARGKASAKGENPPFNNNPTESKIAAIGVRIRQWVTYHGIAVNIHPDLNHYKGIVPCGIKEYGVTSFAGLGVSTTTDEFDQQIIKSFHKIF